MKKKFSKLEITCFCVFFVVAILCFIWYFLYAYFATPEISLKGDKDVVVNLKGTYKEAGAVAYLDNVDISDRIEIKSNVNLRVVGDYEVVYSVTNTKGKRKKTVIRNVKVRDSIKPVIKLKKGKVYKTQYGMTYKEPGYVATDNYDGNITKKVNVRGNVDVNKLGKYKLYYSVVDSSGNKITRIRTVKVVDETSPVIKLRGKSKIIIKKGEPYLEQGCLATDNYDGDITSEVVKRGRVNTSIRGVYTVTYSVSDSFGNYTTKERIVQVGTQSEIDDDNCVMVSIDKQKLWFYKHGKLILTSNVVTGTKNSWDTITGNFRIRSKARNTYLTGADYKSYVNYWMLIDYGTQIGLHDATWRGSFGGSIYKYNGSHGCINLPYWVAQTIYDKAPVGTRVYVY